MTYFAQELDWNDDVCRGGDIESVEEEEYNSITALPQSTRVPLIFMIEKSHRATDLSNMYLSCKYKILNSDDSKITDIAESVSICNLFGYAIWEKVEIIISGERVTLNNTHLPWQIYVQSLLFGTETSRKHLLQSAGFVMDNGNRHDEWNVNNPNEYLVNDGAKQRSTRCMLSRTFETYIKLLTDMITETPRYLPGNTDIQIKLYPNKPSLVLMGPPGKEYNIQILSAKLLVGRIKLTKEAEIGHELYLARHVANFPFRRFDVRTHLVQAQQESIDWVVQHGKFPVRAYVWLMTNSAYNGSYQENMFCFPDFRLKTMQCIRNDVAIPSSTALTYDPYNDECRFYTNIIKSMGMACDIAFSMEDLNRGFMIQVFDLTKNFNSNLPLQHTESGTLRLKINFDVPLASNIVTFCMLETDCLLTIDRNRNPQISYMY